MRKVLFLLVCFICAVSIQAQTKGFEEKSKFGVTINAQRAFKKVGENVSGNLQLTFSRVLVDLSLAGVEENNAGGGIALGYIFNVTPKLNLYPLAGAYFKDKMDLSFMYNIGAGVQYNLFGSFFLSGRLTLRDAGAGLGCYF